MIKVIVKAKDHNGVIDSYTIEDNCLVLSSNSTLEERWYTTNYVWEIQGNRLWMFKANRSMGMCFGDVTELFELTWRSQK